MRRFLAVLGLTLAACSVDVGEAPNESFGATSSAIHSGHAGNAPWKHVLTCYGGCSAPHYDPSACGHNTSCGPIADGSWWYATERAAFHCGAKLKLERDGKCVVVDVQDNGPADWVESNAASTCGVGYIIDTSPLVADYFGGGCGWGECFTVDVSPVPDSTPTGPCSQTAENCAESQAGDCGAYGCACVDGQCNGGFCPGTGCSAQTTANCGAYGCGCVDGECNGVFCPGTGCTAKETNDCAAYGCNCVDHACNGGFCDGTGCTAKETMDCGNYGCGCVDHQCNGVFCDGSGCTAKQTLDCEAAGQTCKDGQCVAGAPPTSNESDAGASEDGGVPPSGEAGSGWTGSGPVKEADNEPPTATPANDEGGSCALGRTSSGGPSSPAWLMLLVVLARFRPARPKPKRDELDALLVTGPAGSRKCDRVESPCPCTAPEASSLPFDATATRAPR